MPLLDKYGIYLGVQNHCDRFVGNAAGLRRLIEKHDPRHIGAVWDAAHEALNGLEPELAIDVVWSHLCMVNLKNAFWPRVAEELKRRGYEGVVCLAADYSDGHAVDRLIAEDIAFAKSLFA